MTLNTLWLIVGGALFYFLLNAIATAQGWPFKLPGISFDKADRYAVALIATPIGLAGLTTLLFIGRSYARVTQAENLWHRLPVSFNLGDPNNIILHIL